SAVRLSSSRQRASMFSTSRRVPARRGPAVMGSAGFGRTSKHTEAPPATESLKQPIRLFDRDVRLGSFRLTDDVEPAADAFLDGNDRNGLLVEWNLHDPLG